MLNPYDIWESIRKYYMILNVLKLHLLEILSKFQMIFTYSIFGMAITAWIFINNKPQIFCLTFLQDLIILYFNDLIDFCFRVSRRKCKLVSNLLEDFGFWTVLFTDVRFIYEEVSTDTLFFPEIITLISSAYTQIELLIPHITPGRPLR